MKHGFCDFCDTTDDDGNQREDLSHAQTADNGKWICDICYYYDECLRSSDNPLGPCRENSCKHQPKLMTKWAIF